MFNKKVPKLFSFFIVFFLVFNLNVPRAHAGLADAIAGAIWSVFDVFMGDKASEANDAISEVTGDEVNQDALDQFEARLDTELVDVFTRNNLFNEMTGDDLSAIGDDFSADMLDDLNIDLDTQIGKLGTINNILDEAMGRLERAGFFDRLENTLGYTKEEFRRILMNIYLRDVINPVIDPLTNSFVNSEDDLTYEITPRNPRPGDTVTIELKSSGINLNAANIEWKHNNTTILNGQGETFLSDFVLNQGGLREEIVVVVKKSGGGIIEQIISIHPSNVDIIYEVDTYIPPFYEGKPEYAHNSMVKFIAIPSVLDENGRQMGTDEFVYKWYVDNQIVQESQRVGKNYFYYKDDFSGRDMDVSVNVKSIDNEFNTLQGISVSPIDPEIVLYEDNPKYGVLFNRAFSNRVETSQKEISIKAAPYFFSNNSDIDFVWALNNRELLDFNRSIVTFRSDTDNSLASNLSVTINNNDEIAQSAYNYFNLLVNN